MVSYLSIICYISLMNILFIYNIHSHISFACCQTFICSCITFSKRAVFGALNKDEMGVASVKFGGKDVSLNSRCWREKACTTYMRWKDDASSVLTVNMLDAKS